jgi:hypothetical protein
MTIKGLKDLFIPHKGNNYTPDFLERASMGVMFVLILLTFAIANIQALLWVGSDWMVSAILPAVIVDLTNEERMGGSLTTLKRNTLLDTAAQMKAEDMVRNGYFAHYSPEGLSPWYWFQKAGYIYAEAGENLAVHFTDSEEVVDAWMESPGHRANIINKNYTEIGVGSARGEYNGVPTIFVVQLFGTQSLVSKIEPSSAVSENEVVTDSTISQELAQESLNTEKVLGEEITIEPFVVKKQEIPVIVAEFPPVSMPVSENNVVYSDLATTSYPGSVRIEQIDDQSIGSVDTTRNLTVLEKSIVQPSAWLQIVYIVLAILVTIALILSVVIEWRKQRPIQIAYATGLLAIMALLLYAHTTLTGGVIII